jgi:hypothetical protein
MHTLLRVPKGDNQIEPVYLTPARAFCGIALKYCVHGVDQIRFADVATPTYLVINSGPPRFDLRAWRRRTVLAPLDASMARLARVHRHGLGLRLSVYGRGAKAPRSFAEAHCGSLRSLVTGPANACRPGRSNWEEHGFASWLPRCVGKKGRCRCLPRLPPVRGRRPGEAERPGAAGTIDANPLPSRNSRSSLPLGLTRAGPRRNACGERTLHRRRRRPLIVCRKEPFESKR